MKSYGTSVEVSGESGRVVYGVVTIRV
jgi:hypothetical protein